MPSGGWSGLVDRSDRLDASCSFERRSLAVPVARLSAGLLALYVFAVAATAWFHPVANWDAIAYAAAVERKHGLSDEALHAAAYAVVREWVSPDDYRKLTLDRAYRVRQAADPRAFASMLPFYETKLGYVAAARALTPWLGTFDALRLVSVASVLAIGAVALAWLAGAGALPWAGAVALALGLSGFGTVAAITVPDLLAAALLLAMAWAFVRGRDAAAIALLVAAVLVRPDHVALAGVLMVAGLGARMPPLPLVAGFAAAFAAYLHASGVADHPGWWVQFHFTNVAYAPTLEGFSPDPSVAVYAEALLRSVVRALTRETWPFVALPLFAAAAWMAWTARLSRRETVLAAALLVATAAKYVIFPLHEGRFHIATIAVLACLLAAAAPRATAR